MQGQAAGQRRVEEWVVSQGRVEAGRELGVQGRIQVLEVREQEPLLMQLEQKRALWP